MLLQLPGGAHGRIYGPCIVCIVFTHGFQRKSKNSLKTNSETVGMAEFCGALLETYKLGDVQYCVKPCIVGVGVKKMIHGHRNLQMGGNNHFRSFGFKVHMTWDIHMINIEKPPT